MPKKIVDYETFCAGVETAVEKANVHAFPQGVRYEIARLEEGGMFHICLMRLVGAPQPTFDLARVLMRVYYPDMTKDEFMDLAAFVVSGRTNIEEFDAIAILTLYEFFCEVPDGK